MLQILVLSGPYQVLDKHGHSSYKQLYNAYKGRIQSSTMGLLDLFTKPSYKVLLKILLKTTQACSTPSTHTSGRHWSGWIGSRPTGWCQQPSHRSRRHCRHTKRSIECSITRHCCRHTQRARSTRTRSRCRCRSECSIARSIECSTQMLHRMPIDRMFHRMPHLVFHRMLNLTFYRTFPDRMFHRAIVRRNVRSNVRPNVRSNVLYRPSKS